MTTRRDRARAQQDEADRITEHAEVRARLLVMVERTEQYAVELTAEVERWNDEREEAQQ